jgi:hypothetical protein
MTITSNERQQSIKFVSVEGITQFFDEIANIPDATIEGMSFSPVKTVKINAPPETALFLKIKYDNT